MISVLSTFSVPKVLSLIYILLMTRRVPISRLPDTPIYEKPSSVDYHPATALWLRCQLGHRLTASERKKLERYLFRQRFPLQ